MEASNFFGWRGVIRYIMKENAIPYRMVLNPMRQIISILFIALILGSDLAFPQQAVDLTLQHALQVAQATHPLLAEGQAGIEIQHGVETQARSAELPQINYNSSYARANSRGSAFGQSQVFTTYVSEFSLNQLLYDFGRTPELVRASHEQVIAAQETYQYDLQQVLFGVYQDYYQLLEAKANVQVQQENVTDLKEHLEQAKTFFQVGTQPKIDVTQAESNLSNGQLTLVQAENTFAISQTNLKTAMGDPNFPPFVVNEELKEPFDFSITLDDAVKEAYQHRQDLLALIAQELSAEASLNATEKDYFPAFTASAGAGNIGSTYYPYSSVWNLGVQFSVPLFNGFLTAGEIQQAKGTLHNLQAQVDNQRLTVRQAVEQAYNNLVSARTSLNVARDGLQYAKENFELANGSYRVGTVNYVQYTDAENAYVLAKSNLITALGNYNIAIASMEEAMGTLTATNGTGAKP